MRKEKVTLLFLAAGGMEMSWLYAWANFLITSILDRSFPFPEALTAFGLATIVTLISSGRGWRIIQIIGLQVFGLIFAASRIVYAFNSFPSSFWSKDWIVQFSNQPRGPLEWFTLILLLLWSIFFWIGGIALARRPMTYIKVCSRFDLGLGAFFLLFLVKLVPLVNEGIRLNDPASELLLFPFFIFSLLAIGLARSRSDARKDFLPGWQGTGVILSFTATVLLFGTGLVLFFLPYLTLTARAAHAILRIAGQPLVSIFLAILRFMYGRGITRPEEPSAPATGGLESLSAPAESSWWLELLEKVVVWGLGSIVVLVTVVLFCLALFYLFRWLFSRTSISRMRPGRRDLISSWVERLRTFLLFIWKKIGPIVRGYRGAAQLYAALLNWGRHSGLSHLSSETPREYGLRLKHYFPALKREIELIIEAFQLEVYGGMTLRNEQVAQARFAWRRLRSPFHWPSRLRRWCGRQDAVPEQQSRPPRTPRE